MFSGLRGTQAGNRPIELAELTGQVVAWRPELPISERQITFLVSVGFDNLLGINHEN
jgi:hypothetical protein